MFLFSISISFSKTFRRPVFANSSSDHRSVGLLEVERICRDFVLDQEIRALNDLVLVSGKKLDLSLRLINATANCISFRQWLISIVGVSTKLLGIRLLSRHVK